MDQIMGPYAEARDAEKQGKQMVLELFGLSERAILGLMFGTIFGLGLEPFDKESQPPAAFISYF